MQEENIPAMLEKDKDNSDVDDASDRLVLIEREEGLGQMLEAGSSEAVPQDQTAGTLLEHGASVETLQPNCNEASSFDTNVQGSEADDSSKQAVAESDGQTIASQTAGLFSPKAEKADAAARDSETSEHPDITHVNDSCDRPHSSWLPESVSKFSSTAEMLASQAAGLFSKKGEEPEPAKAAGEADASGEAAAESGPSAQRGERWFPDHSSASLTSFTRAAETFATQAAQAAGLFSSKSSGRPGADADADAGAGADADAEDAPAAPSSPPEQTDHSAQEMQASLCESDSAGSERVGQHAVNEAETQECEEKEPVAAAKKVTSWVPDGSAESLSRWRDAAGTVATQAMGLFGAAESAQAPLGQEAETSQSPDAPDHADASAHSNGSFSKIKTAAESIAAQASGMFLHGKNLAEEAAPSAGRSLADLSGAWSQLAMQTTDLLSPLSPRWTTQAGNGDATQFQATPAEAEGEGSCSESSELEAELQRRRSRLSGGFTGRCWRCGAEIVAELDAVEAHEEICSRPMQQLLDAAELLAPRDPVSAEGSPSREEQPSTVSWTHKGVSALADLKQSVQATSSSVARRACEAAGYGGSGSALTPELDPLQVYGRIESTVEAVVLLVLDPVLKGLPSLGVLPVRVEARRAVGEHGNPGAAVAALLAKVEMDDGECGMSQRVLRKVSELLVMRFLPVVGAGAFLSYTVYIRLRLAALVAEMYGHDAEDAEVQGLLFFCVLPGGGDGPSEEAPDACGPVADGNGPSGPTAAVRAAKGLGHGLARQVVQRSTGWRSAADLYDLAAAICSERTGTDEATEGPQLATVRRAIHLFQPSRASESGHPAILALLGLGAAAPTLLAVAFQFLRLVQLASLLLGGLGAPLLIALLLILVVAMVVMRWELLDAFSERPEVVSSGVFLVQAILPLLAAFSGSSLIVEGALRKLIAGSGPEDGGMLFLLLGGWTWLRLWQRMQAPEGSAAARGEASLEQRAMLAVVVALGATDLSGHEGLALHPLPSFGTLRSKHWFLGLLQAQALECQLYLMMLLRNRQVLLRLLGATRMMSLCVTLFLGGITASVGFLVSRSEFLHFLDGLAPPPRVTAVLLALRREHGLCAMLLGASAGLLWQLPSGLAIVSKAGGIVLGAAAGGLFWATYEEYREVLEEPSGGRWLLLLPGTSEKAKVQALHVWSRLKLGITEAAVERSASLLGRGMLDTLLNRIGYWWCSAGVVDIAEKVAEAES